MSKLLLDINKTHSRSQWKKEVRQEMATIHQGTARVREAKAGVPSHQFEMFKV